MGARAARIQSREAEKDRLSHIPSSMQLSEQDYHYLTDHTGISKHEIDKFYEKFLDENPDGKMGKHDFIRLYRELNDTPHDVALELADFVFQAFDYHNNNNISFTEFLIYYVLTIPGDSRKKLECAFILYDMDKNGSLDHHEINSILGVLLQLLGAHKKEIDSSRLIEKLKNDCFALLDTNGDGKINKNEFISGLLSDPVLKGLLTPFG